MSDYLKSLATATTLIPVSGFDKDVSFVSANEDRAISTIKDAEGITSIHQAFQIWIKIGNTEYLVALCQSIKGLSIKRDCKEFAVGGSPNTQYFTPGKVKYGDVTITNVISNNPAFLQWIMSNSSSSGGRIERLDISVKVGIRIQKKVEEETVPATAPLYNFTLKNAVPVSWSMGEIKISPNGNGNAFFESITFKFSNLEYDVSSETINKKK